MQLTVAVEHHVEATEVAAGRQAGVPFEDREPLGPSGAKGIGEPALVPTAPAILGAIDNATGVRMRRVPVLPHRLREAILAKGKGRAS